MNAVHTLDVSTTQFDPGFLASKLDARVIGGWSREDVIDEAAIRWLNDHRLRNGQRWAPIYPEAEDLGPCDFVALAELVSKHLGAELFGLALKKDLDINRLVDAFKRGDLDVEAFVSDVRNGTGDDPRYFGFAPLDVRPAQPRKDVFRDKSGFTRRDKLEMLSAYRLDKERLADIGSLVVAEDLLRAREDNALWPESEVLEARGVDIVALEKARAAIGTDELANLYANGFDLGKLALRVRNGLDANLLVRAFTTGATDGFDSDRFVKVFNSTRFPSGMFARRIRLVKLDARDFVDTFDLSGLMGSPLSILQ